MAFGWNNDQKPCALDPCGDGCLTHKCWAFDQCGECKHCSSEDGPNDPGLKKNSVVERFLAAIKSDLDFNGRYGW